MIDRVRRYGLIYEHNISSVSYMLYMGFTRQADLSAIDWLATNVVWYVNLIYHIFHGDRAMYLYTALFCSNTAIYVWFPRRADRSIGYAIWNVWISFCVNLSRNPRAAAKNTMFGGAVKTRTICGCLSRASVASGRKIYRFLDVHSAHLHARPFYSGRGDAMWPT
jgi:hypothetical protein